MTINMLIMYYPVSLIGFLLGFLAAIIMVALYFIFTGTVTVLAFQIAVAAWLIFQLGMPAVWTAYTIYMVLND